MDIVYFKRLRMEIHLAGRDLTPTPLPPSYRLLAWNASLLDAFAEAKHRSFRNEMDANVFPCLSEFEGCRRLMAEIARRPGFLPEATWLAVYSLDGHPLSEYCGTVQGVRDPHGCGAIQNLGAAPEHRCIGLGACLLLHCLNGFRRAGVQRVYLEVTAQNQEAIRLYRRIGFTTIRTVYKTVEAEYST